MQHPQAIGTFAVGVGGSGVEVDQHIFFQARQAAVLAELHPPVVGGGAGREHFDNQLGLGFDVRTGLVQRTAGYQHVRVKIAVRRSHVQAHVAHVGAARATTEVLAQRKSHVQGNSDMPVFGPCHCKNFTVQVLMPLELLGLPGQIVCGGKNGFLYCLSHSDALGGESVAHYEGDTSSDATVGCHNSR